MEERFFVQELCHKMLGLLRRAVDKSLPDGGCRVALSNVFGSTGYDMRAATWDVDLCAVVPSTVVEYGDDVRALVARCVQDSGVEQDTIIDQRAPRFLEWVEGGHCGTDVRVLLTDAGNARRALALIDIQRTDHTERPAYRDVVSFVLGPLREATVLIKHGVGEAVVRLVKAGGIAILWAELLVASRNPSGKTEVLGVMARFDATTRSFSVQLRGVAQCSRVETGVARSSIPVEAVGQRGDTLGNEVWQSVEHRRLPRWADAVGQNTSAGTSAADQVLKPARQDRGRSSQDEATLSPNSSKVVVSGQRMENNWRLSEDLTSQLSHADMVFVGGACTAGVSLRNIPEFVALNEAVRCFKNKSTVASPLQLWPL